MKIDHYTNSEFQNRIERHALQMLGMWRKLIVDADGDQWKHHKERQAYHDALLSLRQCGLIQNYDVTNCRVLIGTLHENGILFKGQPDPWPEKENPPEG